MEISPSPQNLISDGVIKTFEPLTMGHMDTSDFLTSSRGVVRLVESFGEPFLPVRVDMSMNITKIEEVYKTDPVHNSFVDELIKNEQLRKETKATEALLWLYRGLKLFHRFLELVVKNHREGPETESIKQFLKIAYDETLRMHHTWFTRQLFDVLSIFCPTRTHLTRGLAVNVNECSLADHHVQLMKDMDRYIKGLGLTLDHITDLCLE